MKIRNVMNENNLKKKKVDFKKGLKMSESAETSEVKAATLTNHPYGAGLAEQQAAADFMGRRDEYVFIFPFKCQAASRLPAGCKLATLLQVKTGFTEFIFMTTYLHTSFLPSSDTTGSFFSFWGFSPYVPAVSVAG